MAGQESRLHRLYVDLFGHATHGIYDFEPRDYETPPRQGIRPLDDARPIREMTVANSFYPKLRNSFEDPRENYKIKIERVPLGTDLFFDDELPESKILLFLGDPIFIGRWYEPYDANKDTNGGYQKNELAEFFVHHLCGHNCMYNSRNDANANVDILRTLQGEPRREGGDPQLQGLEVKLVSGYARHPPFWIRGSVAQLKALQNMGRYANPSGYVVVSRDFIRHTPDSSRSRENASWIYTLWFLNASNPEYWKELRPNNQRQQILPDPKTKIYFRVLESGGTPRKRRRTPKNHPGLDRVVEDLNKFFS